MKYHFNSRKNSFVLVLLLALMSFTGFANYFAYSSKTIEGAEKISSKNEGGLCIEHLDVYDVSIYGKEGLSIEVLNRALSCNVGSEDDALSDSDFDSDGIDNAVDADDDNDGILDNVECAYPSVPPTFDNFFLRYYNSDNGSGMKAATNMDNNYISSAKPWSGGTGLTATSVGYPYNYISISGVGTSTLTQAQNGNDFIVHEFTTTSDNYNWLYYAHAYYPSAQNYHWAILISDDNFTTYTVLHSNITAGTAGNYDYNITDFLLQPSTTYQIRTYFWGNNGNIIFDDFGVYGYSECDTDKDFLPNRIDLDSDGDGCSDAIEGGGSFTSSDLVSSSMDGGNTGSGFTGNPGVDPVKDNLGNTVGANGVPTIASGGQSAGSSQTKDGDADADGLGASCDCYDQPRTDSDSDGVPDDSDVDDDNDGISDDVECTYPPVPPTFDDLFFAYYNTPYSSGSKNASNVDYNYISSAAPWSGGSGLTATAIGSPDNHISISGVNATNLTQALSYNEYLVHNFTTTSDNYNWLYYARAYYRTAQNYHWAILISDDNFVTHTVLNSDIVTAGTTGNSNYNITDFQLQPSTAYQIRTYYWGNTGTFIFDDFSVFGYSECDKDNDFLPNRIDLDSDNDGIPDAIEACDGVDYAMLTNCRLPFDNTAVNSQDCQTGVTISPCGTPLNTDAGKATGDTTPDYLDLDSDGDGCSDSQESFGIEVTGTNISTYDGSISVDGSTGLTTSIMCDTITTADENKNGLPMYRDTDENICVYPNRDFGDLSTNNNRYAELYARQYADANNDFKPEGDSAVWLGSKVDFERWYQSSLLADGDDNDAEGDDDDGLEITVPAPSTGTDRTGVWTVTANGNTSGTKVYISLRIDWNNDGTFADYAGVKEIYMTSIVIGSPTSKAITIAYPDSYDGTSDMLNVRLVGGKTPESANMVSGRLVDGEVEDYFFTSSALLPIEFLSFTAEADGFDGLLEWEVSSELPNSHFEIERSIDGYVFNKIGQVEGKGSATEVERYAYTDVGVGKYVSGNVYYRLKQIDVDGEYKYSSQEVISFGLSRQMEIEIYPNPVREELYIHMLGKEDDRKITMEICGTQGKVLLTKDNFRGGMVKVEDLSPGVYMLKFTEGGKTVEYMKFIKM